MINKELAEKIKEFGFGVEVFNGGKIKVYNEAIPSVETVMALFKLLTYDETLTFWNSFHKNPSKSDPGSFVSVYFVDDHLVFMEGNHGWSSAYKRASFDEMADFIIKNWDKTYDLRSKDYLNYILIEPHLYAQRDKKKIFSI